MASPVSGACAAALAAMIAGVFCRSAQAADMPFVTPPAPPLNEGMAEFGTGWYLRGDIAAARTPVLDIDGAKTSPDFPNGWAAGLGFGYQYNNWFRTDATADYEELFSRSGPEFVSLPCQIGAAPVKDASGTIIGSTPIFAGCFPFFESRATTAAFLANAYVDLGHWRGFTPYVGAGVGVDVLFQKSQVHWFQGNGVPLAGVTWTDPFNGGVFMQNWDRVFSNTSLRFAYAFMGGVAYNVTDHIKVDIGYRWLNLGEIIGGDLFGVPVKRQLTVQQVRAGLRYVID